MRRIRSKHIASLGFMLLAVAVPLACVSQADEFPNQPPPGGGGVDSGGGGGGADTGVPPVIEGCPTAPPSDDATGIKDKCGVFVSAAKGNDDGDGTNARPLKSLQKAIEAAKGKGLRVYACADSYPEQIVLASNVYAYGYFDCTAAAWTVGSAKARIAPSVSPAVKAKEIRDVRLDGFEIRAPNVTEGSSIALVSISSALHLAKSIVHAGTGGRGADGVEGIPLTLADGSKGEDGVAGEECCGTRDATQKCIGGWNQDKLDNHWRPRNGGGGHCVGPGSTNRETPAGGMSGRGGAYQWSNGWVETAGGGPRAGEAQTSSHARGGDIDSNANIAAGAEGEWGGNGVSGGDFGAVAVEGNYVASDGTAGTDGKPGAGGGGGGGRTSAGGASEIAGKFCSATGAGGGAGGCPGLAGTPGRGGGASIAIVAVDSSVDLVDCSVDASAGGAGGRGTNGSARTSGGAGGTVSGSYGGGLAGATGGLGGVAGASGSGGGGPSIGVVYHGGAPSLARSPVTVGTGGAGVAPIPVDGRITVPESKQGFSGELRQF